VRWPIGIVEPSVESGAPPARTDEVAVAPDLVLEEQRRRVVVGAAQQQIGGCRQGVVSGVRPEREMPRVVGSDRGDLGQPGIDQGVELRGPLLVEPMAGAGPADGA
jgi:hypothetical protein